MCLYIYISFEEMLNICLQNNTVFWAQGAEFAIVILEKKQTPDCNDCISDGYMATDHPHTW